MAEVKKKFSELDPGSVPFTGTEIIAAVQGGQSKRGTISGIHGAGWWDQLKAAFVDFIAPDALHANDADTIGGETSAELRNAGALTGTLPLGVIPAELTGKNAATATSAGKLTNARTITVNGDATGSVTFDGSSNRTLTLDVTYATSAGSAGYATSAGSATTATTATNAGYATSAGSATTATTATNAGYATSAGSATSATTATTAASAAKLTNARTITVNGDATGSVSFDGSGNRTLTLDVTYATSAGSATNAGYATSAGSATNATNATNVTSTDFDGEGRLALFNSNSASAQQLARGPYIRSTITSYANYQLKNTVADGQLNSYGASLPSAGIGQHGRFFYRTSGDGSASALYYCAQTSESYYSWIKISE